MDGKRGVSGMRRGEDVRRNLGGGGGGGGGMGIMTCNHIL